MKKFLCLLLCFCMILPAVGLAEEDISIDEELEEVTLDDDGNEIIVDEDTGETFVIKAVSDEELDELDAEIDTSIDVNDLHINPNLPKDTINILLVGVDTHYKEMGKGLERGDVQIIVSIDPDAGTIKLSSIMRDLYVPIVGLKNSNRINIAYSQNGGAGSMSTINDLFELNIQHYVAINFYGVISIVESLGGIDVELSKAEANFINSYLKKNKAQISREYDDKKGKRTALEKKNGVQHLDGLQALIYARTRTSSSTDNDFARTSRQRHLLELLLNKVLTDDDTDYFDLLSTCLDYVKTNMNASDIWNILQTVLRSDLIQRAKEGETLLEDFRIPMDDTWKYANKNGRDVVVFRTDARQEENVKTLHEFIYGAYYPANAQ